MATKFVPAEYDEIRLLIDRDLDDDDLTDDAIASETVLGAAESFVMEYIPGGTTGLNAKETRTYRRAVMYRCVWILTPSFPQQTAENVGQLSVRHQATPVEHLKQVRHEQVMGEIQKLIDAGHGVDTDAFTPAVAVFTVN